MKEMRRSRKSTRTRVNARRPRVPAGRVRRKYVTRRPGTMQLNNAVPLFLPVHST